MISNYSQLIRSSECIVYFMGDNYTVTVSQAMVDGGWPGGQGVTWVAAPPGVDDRVVSYARGLYGGILIFGSNEANTAYTSGTGSQQCYRYATIACGGSLISTSTYERYTYASRVAGGPLVPISYGIGNWLYFSLRGYFTNEDELTLSGDPMAPCFFVGMCAQVPKDNNNFYLGVQTSM